MKVNWTPELLADIVRLAGTGASASQIGSELGLTRNAVIGKMHRQKIPLLGVSKGGHQPGMPRKHRKKAVLKTFVEREMPPLPTNVPLPELDPFGCKWPIGDPATPGFVFCNTRRTGHRSYCAGHCRMAYRPDVR